MSEIIPRLYEVLYREKYIDVVPTPPSRLNNGSIPKVLYKYRDWGSDRHKKSLTDLQLWRSSPIEFNDSYDCKIPFDYSILKNEVARRAFFSNALRSLEEAGYSIQRLYTEEPFESVVDRVVNELTFENFDTNRATKQYYEMFAQEVGIYCTTPHNDNILMWAHYGNNSRGFCIGYDSEEMIKRDYFEVCMKINYVDSLDIPMADPLGDIYKNTEEICGNKFMIWSYEDEYRFIKLGLQDRLVYLHPKCIYSIVLGPAISEEHKVEIIQTLQKEKFRHVRLYQARESNRQFLIEIFEIGNYQQQRLN